MIIPITRLTNAAAKAEAERNLQGVEGAAAGEDAPELIEAQFESLEEQAASGIRMMTESHVSVSPMVRPNPGNVLRRAAAALTMPPASPRPDQFL